MELRRYVMMLWRWLWLIVLGTVLAAGIAFVFSRGQTPVYEASSMLLVSQSKTQIMDASLTSAGDRLAATYSELLHRQPVLEEVIRRLQLRVSAVILADAVKIQPVRNTQLIQVIVEDTDPVRAAAIANEIPKVFIRQNDQMQTQRFAESKASLQKQLQDSQAEIARLQDSIAALQAADKPNTAEIDSQQRDLRELQTSYSTLYSSFEGLRLEEAKQLDTLLVTEQAQPPVRPIRPRTLQNTLLAAVVGALLALCTAYVSEYLDDKLKSAEEVREVLGLTTLSAVPVIDEKVPGDELIVMTNGQSTATEAYRILRTNLQFAAVGKPLRSLLMTSAAPSEGKTRTTANLGAVLAQAGRRVILVDADLHRPRLHRPFKLPNNTGVTTALLAPGVDLEPLLHETPVAGLRVLTSGPLPPNAAELLGTNEMRDLLARLESLADIVILDSPPTMALSDAAILASQVDGVLLVLDASQTRRDLARRAVESLQQVQARLLGTVLNRVSTQGGGAYYYYSQYGSYYGTEDGRDGDDGSAGGGALGKLKRRLGGGKATHLARQPEPRTRREAALRSTK